MLVWSYGFIDAFDVQPSCLQIPAGSMEHLWVFLGKADCLHEESECNSAVIAVIGGFLLTYCISFGFKKLVFSCYHKYLHVILFPSN